MLTMLHSANCEVLTKFEFIKNKEKIYRAWFFVGLSLLKLLWPLITQVYNQFSNATHIFFIYSHIFFKLQNLLFVRNLELLAVAFIWCTTIIYFRNIIWQTSAYIGDVRHSVQMFSTNCYEANKWLGCGRY